MAIDTKRVRTGTRHESIEDTFDTTGGLTAGVKGSSFSADKVAFRAAYDMPWRTPAADTNRDNMYRDGQPCRGRYDGVIGTRHDGVVGLNADVIIKLAHERYNPN